MDRIKSFVCRQTSQSTKLVTVALCVCLSETYMYDPYVVSSDSAQGNFITMLSKWQLAGQARQIATLLLMSSLTNIP
jgi:hypothetical protein